MGKIFYIMGKSASGKDRIYSLLAAHKELNLKTLILYTTRPIRVGEQDGKNYYFVDDGKLEEFRKNGNLIEERAYHTVYGIWTYFTADDGQVNLQIPIIWESVLWSHLKRCVNTMGKMQSVLFMSR